MYGIYYEISMVYSKEDGCLKRKWRAEHSRELHLKLKCLVTTKEYLSATFGPNIHFRSLDLCLYRVSIIVLGLKIEMILHKEFDLHISRQGTAVNSLTQPIS